MDRDVRLRSAILEADHRVVADSTATGHTQNFTGSVVSQLQQCSECPYFWDLVGGDLDSEDSFEEASIAEPAEPTDISSHGSTGVVAALSHNAAGESNSAASVGVQSSKAELYLAWKGSRVVGIVLMKQIGGVWTLWWRKRLARNLGQRRKSLLVTGYGFKIRNWFNGMRKHCSQFPESVLHQEPVLREWRPGRHGGLSPMTDEASD